MNQDSPLSPVAGSDDSAKTIVVVSVMAVVFLAAMEWMVTSTIMPSVIGAIGGMALYPWVTATFMLASTITTPLYGKLSDVHGRKRFVLVAIAVFLTGSVLCGLATSMTQLILFRAVQGVGAGGLMTMSFVVFGLLFPPEKRARMQGLLSSMWALASIAGPLVGAAAVQWLSWRWAFIVNVPIGVVAAWLIAVNLHLPAEPVRPFRLDLAGVGLFAASMTALLLASMALGQGQGAGVMLIGLAIAGGLFAVLIAYERRVAEPVLPISLFREPAFRVAVTLAAVGTAGFFATMTILPLYLQGGLGLSPGLAGQVLVAISLSWVTGSFVGGRILHAVGFRSPAVAGSVAIVASYLMFYWASGGADLRLLFTGCALLGLGMGLTATVSLMAVQSAAPRHMLGAATSGSQLFRTIGGTLGISLFGGLQLAYFTRALAALAVAQPNPLWERIVREPHRMLEGAGRLKLPPELLARTTQALAGSIHQVFLMAAVMSVAGIVLALRMPVSPGVAADPVPGAQPGGH